MISSSVRNLTEIWGFAHRRDARDVAIFAAAVLARGREESAVQGGMSNDLAFSVRLPRNIPSML